MDSPPANAPPKFPGTSPTKPQIHTKFDTRHQQSLAVRESLTAHLSNAFDITFLNALNAELTEKISKAVSPLVSKVQRAIDQKAGYKAVPELLNTIATLLGASSVIHSPGLFSFIPHKQPRIRTMRRKSPL